MVLFLLNIADRYETAAKRLVDELVISSFLEEEEKLGMEFADGSIVLLKTVTSCGLFGENIVKRAQQQLQKLCMKYSKEWMSFDAFTGGGGQEGKVVKGKGLKPKPKLRARTSLGGAIRAHGPIREGEGGSKSGNGKISAQASYSGRPNSANKRFTASRQSMGGG
jgi:hypothetical protein